MSQKRLPPELQGRLAWSFGQGGKVNSSAAVQPMMLSGFAAVQPNCSHVPQQRWKEPTVRIHIGWMFTSMADNSTIIVGWCCSQKVPDRRILQVQYVNCTRLNMSVIIIATWNPWKKSTAPVPEPPFIADAPTLKIAATTIGQHQAPTTAGSARIIVPTAPKNCQTLIGSSASVGSGSSITFVGPQLPSGQSPASAANGSLAADISDVQYGKLYRNTNRG